MTAVADAAGVATGTVYRHVANKDELLSTVFRRAAGRELAQVESVAATAGPPLLRLERCLRTFGERALQSRRLAYALLAEPAGPAVEEERLVFRTGYRGVFRDLLVEAVEAGEVEPHDEALVAAVLTGAMGEALIGPLAPLADEAVPADQRVGELVDACLRALPPGPDRRRLTGQ